MDAPPYDTVIVGAGPAGCVLAARLSGDPARRVLLVEAGPDYGPDPATWPPELVVYDGPQLLSHGWGYLEATRGVALPRGRLPGGSSAINTAVWLRGSRADYDRWADLGNPS